jgi:hypothetical protein
MILVLMKHPPGQTCAAIRAHAMVSTIPAQSSSSRGAQADVKLENRSPTIRPSLTPCVEGLDRPRSLFKVVPPVTLGCPFGGRLLPVPVYLKCLHLTCCQTSELGQYLKLDGIRLGHDRPSPLLLLSFLVLGSAKMVRAVLLAALMGVASAFIAPVPTVSPSNRYAAIASYVSVATPPFPSDRACMYATMNRMPSFHSLRYLDTTG